jgi:hypothetical protein
MIAFLKVGEGKKIKGWYECPECNAPSTEAFVVDGRAKWTCPNGHECTQ